MRKLATLSIDNRPKVRKARLMAAVILPIILILSPILYESAILCVASWQGLFGAYPQTNTPILNGLGNFYEMVSFDFKWWFHGVFNRTPWRSSFVIPFAIFWTAVLALLLRKG